MSYYILLPRERLNATKDKCYTHDVNDSISRQTKNPAVISYASFKRSVRALFKKRKAPCPIKKLRSAERTSQLFFFGRLKDGSPRRRICPFRSAAPGDDRTHAPSLGGLHAPLKPGGPRGLLPVEGDCPLGSSSVAPATFSRLPAGELRPVARAVAPRGPRGDAAHAADALQAGPDGAVLHTTLLLDRDRKSVV